MGLAVVCLTWSVEDGMVFVDVLFVELLAASSKCKRKVVCLVVCFVDLFDVKSVNKYNLRLATLATLATLGVGYHRTDSALPRAALIPIPTTLNLQQWNNLFW